jgi:hypothetical protein
MRRLRSKWKERKTDLMPFLYTFLAKHWFTGPICPYVVFAFGIGVSVEEWLNGVHEF